MLLSKVTKYQIAISGQIILCWTKFPACINCHVCQLECPCEPLEGTLSLCHVFTLDSLCLIMFQLCVITSYWVPYLSLCYLCLLPQRAGPAKGNQRTCHCSGRINSIVLKLMS